MQGSLLRPHVQATKQARHKPMFEERTYKRTFFSAPQSVTSLVAALLEPTITVLTFLAASIWYDAAIERPISFSAC